MAIGLLGTTRSGAAAERWLQHCFAPGLGLSPASPCTARQMPRTFTELNIWRLVPMSSSSPDQADRSDLCSWGGVATKQLPRKTDERMERIWQMMSP